MRILTVFLAVILVTCVVLYLALPKSKFHQDVPFNGAYDITCSGRVCDVFFGSSIVEQQKYMELAKLIELAPEDGIINLHLTGNGGHLDSVFYLENAIALSKGTVNTIVDGPVYSAHAYLATLGKTLTIGPNVVFMFHYPATRMKTALGVVMVHMTDVCFGVTGTDRGQPMVDKCKESMEMYLKSVETFYNHHINKYLTRKQQEDVKIGKDIYISGGQMREMLSK
jgi:hypothetical protein